MAFGRDPSCQICITNDPMISRIHALAQWSGTEWMIADNNSSNGTFLNGNRIFAPTRLRAGDNLQIGSTQIVLDQPGVAQATIPSAPPNLFPLSGPKESLPPWKKKPALEKFRSLLNSISNSGTLSDDDISRVWKLHQDLGLELTDTYADRCNCWKNMLITLMNRELHIQAFDVGKRVYQYIVISESRIPEFVSAERVSMVAASFGCVQESGQLLDWGMKDAGFRGLPGEALYGACRSYLMEEVSQRVTNYGYSSFSFRVAPGVNWRVGGGQGRPVTTSQLAPVAHGLLSITSERILFTGSEVIEILWDDVITLNSQNEGCNIFSHRASVLFAYEWPEVGPLMHYLLEQLVRL